MAAPKAGYDARDFKARPVSKPELLRIVIIHGYANGPYGVSGRNLTVTASPLALQVLHPHRGCQGLDAADPTLPKKEPADSFPQILHLRTLRFQSRLQRLTGSHLIGKTFRCNTCRKVLALLNTPSLRLQQIIILSGLAAADFEKSVPIRRELSTKLASKYGALIRRPCTK